MWCFSFVSCKEKEELSVSQLSTLYTFSTLDSVYIPLRYSNVSSLQWNHEINTFIIFVFVVIVRKGLYTRFCLWKILHRFMQSVSHLIVWVKFLLQLLDFIQRKYLKNNVKSQDYAYRFFEKCVYKDCTNGKNYTVRVMGNIYTDFCNPHRKKLPNRYLINI